MPGALVTHGRGMFWLAWTVEVDILAPVAASTKFSMAERFSGLMVPLAARAMPDLGPVFEQFALDLKREAEENRPSTPAR